MKEVTKSSKPEPDLKGGMEKEDDQKETLISKDEQIGAERLRFSGNEPKFQTVLKNLSTQEKLNFQEFILNSPELSKLGTLKREKPLSVQPENKQKTTK